MIQAGVDLTGKEGYLVKLGNSSGVTVANLPTAVTDRVTHVVVEGGATGTKVALQPLEGGGQVRIVAKGTGSAGGLAVPATTGDFGKIRADAAGLGGGSSTLVGVFEEAFVDGQLALVRVIHTPTITLST